MSMFCFQCEQTAKGSGCTVAGVCGKKEDTANYQDQLTGELINLAQTCDQKKATNSTYKAIVDGLFMTVTNVNFDNKDIEKQIQVIRKERDKLLTEEEKTATFINTPYNMEQIWYTQEDVRSLKSLILLGMRGMAAYAHHARVLGKESAEVNKFFLKGLSALSQPLSPEELLDLIQELGMVNLTCMESLDSANTGAYGNPVPTQVTCHIEAGPFIVVTGHDLHDLKLLLDQSAGKGVNIYTHCEMLPAHGYPELKKYPHLKGNFGTAWQSQQKEFDGIPAPILYTTNCVMPPKSTYEDRIFTTSVVGYPAMTHIGDDKDFTPIIKKALALGGYKEKQLMTGINGGHTLNTGFAHHTVLGVADKVIEGVKAGKIKHFFLVGGCDGAKAGRNYYTDFVKQSPKDTIVLTLACGKFRFNDLDLGEIDGIPRLLDMGQCNDAYSAIQVAVALSKAFNCTINELPLTLVLSWYEQKAVCILLTLLALGLKNMYLGPSLPAFVSPEVLKVLVEKWNLTPIATPDGDLYRIMNK